MKQPPIYDKTLSDVRCKITKSNGFVIVNVIVKYKDKSETEAGFSIPEEEILNELIRSDHP